MNAPDSFPKVEYFDFEKDFMNDNIRCIPMIVRFKLDACGIKLKLKEWSKMNFEERKSLANLPINEAKDLDSYRKYLEQALMRNAGEKPTPLSLDQQNLSWMDTNQIPRPVLTKVQALRMEFNVEQWKSLSMLKRYALVKLARPGHENQNFPRALKEFGLA